MRRTSARRSMGAAPQKVVSGRMMNPPFDAVLRDLGSEPIGDAAALRSRLVPEIRRRLGEGRAEAEAELLSQRDGLGCARRLSDLMDGALQAVHDAVVQHLYPAHNPSSSERLAVVATGGYGRGTLAPGSDVDLLFLLPDKQTAWSESVVEAILYCLWDLKLKVGHATRSVDECLREAKGDMTIRTSLLEARFLFGDQALYDTLNARFDRELIATSSAEFVDAKLRERDARVTKAGASRYLVEPNVKDGKGGLRDLNTLFWIAKYVYRVREPEELVKAGLFTPEEFRLFARCEEFLWRVRCHMHFATGRAEERLTFDLQRSVAERIGLSPRGGLSAVERFMKAYFLIAKDVGDLTAIVCAELEARQAKHRPVLDRVFGRFRRRRGGTLEAEDFIVDNDRINVRGRDGVRARSGQPHPPVLARRPPQPRRSIPTRRGSPRGRCRLIGPSLRNDEEANRLFLDILTSKNAPEVVLRRMNEAGVLGRFIPDFGRIVAMMQFNMYHHYTVDEHLIRSHRRALRDRGRAPRRRASARQPHHPFHPEPPRALSWRCSCTTSPRAGRRTTRSPAPPSRASSGRGSGSTRRRPTRRPGSSSITSPCRRSAQSRDLSDPTTIKSFAAIVQTMERLKLLLVLTIADIKAVGPGVWTGWKGELLRTLYYETEVVLGGGAPDVARSDRVRFAQERLRQELQDWPREVFESYAARHYPAYWLKVEEARRVKHARFVRAAEEGGRTVATQVETDRFRGVTELTVLSPDHPRLLAIITGACAAAGGNIVDAQIFTTADGLALDTIVISRAFDRDEDELRRAERVASAIERALKGEVQDRRPRRRQAPGEGTVATPSTWRPKCRSTTRSRTARRSSRCRASTGRACSTTSRPCSESSTSTSPRPTSPPSARRRSTSST